MITGRKANPEQNGVLEPDAPTLTPCVRHVATLRAVQTVTVKEYTHVHEIEDLS